MDIYLSDHDEMNAKQSNNTKIKGDYHRNTINEENESEGLRTLLSTKSRDVQSKF